MEQRFRIVLLALMLVFAPLARMVEAQTQSNDMVNTAKIRSEVAKRLGNKKTRVKIKLRSGEELKGTIDRADDNAFTVTQDKTGKKIEISYGDVKSVKGRGGLSTWAKIGIAAGVAIVVFPIIVVVALKNFDPFEGGITVR